MKSDFLNENMDVFFRPPFSFNWHLGRPCHHRNARGRGVSDGLEGYWAEPVPNSTGNCQENTVSEVLGVSKTLAKLMNVNGAEKFCLCRVPTCPANTKIKQNNEENVYRNVTQVMERRDSMVERMAASPLIPAIPDLRNVWVSLFWTT